MLINTYTWTPFLFQGQMVSLRLITDPISLYVVNGHFDSLSTSLLWSPEHHRVSSLQPRLSTSGLLQKKWRRILSRLALYNDRVHHFYFISAALAWLELFPMSLKQIPRAFVVQSPGPTAIFSRCCRRHSPPFQMRSYLIFYLHSCRRVSGGVGLLVLSIG